MISTSSCCDNLSIDEIIERAEKGDCEAQYIVGFYYNRDSAIDSPDDEKAFYWLKLAAEQGHCEAQYSLGQKGNDSNLLIVFYVQIMPDDFVMQLHRF
ncbi:hypothetical protein MZ16F85_13170 [Escherichia coli]